MSEALSNNHTIERISGAAKAQESRRNTLQDVNIDYAAIAGLVQGAGEISALARTGAGVSVKASDANLPGMAGRDRGTSSRLMPGRGSAIQALGSSGDATSQAIQEMKQMSSRHDPAARLAGQVPGDAATDASGNASDVSDRSTQATSRADIGATNKATTGVPASASQTGQATNPAATNAASQASGAMSQNGVAQNASRTTSAESKPAAIGITGAQGVRSNVAASGSGTKTGQQGAGSAGTNTNGVANTKGIVAGRGVAFSVEARATGLKAKAADLEAQGKPVEAQAVRGLAAVLRQKGGNVTMRLAPETLGDLKVTMKLDGAQVWASIEATTESARQLLEGQRDSLREALEAHGLKVERLDVSAVKQESGSEPRRTGVKDHAQASQEGSQQGLSSGMNNSSHAGEDRRSEEGWGRTPREFAMGGSARIAGEMDAGGAGEMLMTVRGAPVRVWTEPQGQAMRLRVDAVV